MPLFRRRKQEAAFSARTSDSTLVADRELAADSAQPRLADALVAIKDAELGESVWLEIERHLLSADVGVPTTRRLLELVKAEATSSAHALELLRQVLVEDLATSTSLSTEGSPAIWLVVGVNGVGKTTTIAKLAKRETDLGRRVVLAAADTFRAAATEQLQMWAERVGVSVVHGSEGSDPASVVFDAVEHAAANSADIVIADTAGRIHTKSNLMDEICKVRRVADKASGRVAEVLLVLDATNGQNGITQASVFTEAVDVTGIVLTKLDGAGKGGIVLSVQHELGLPVKLIGVGEQITDIETFRPEQFADALLSDTVLSDVVSSEVGPLK